MGPSAQSLPLPLRHWSISRAPNGASTPASWQTKHGLAPDKRRFSQGHPLSHPVPRHSGFRRNPGSLPPAGEVAPIQTTAAADVHTLSLEMVIYVCSCSLTSKRASPVSRLYPPNSKPLR